MCLHGMKVNKKGLPVRKALYRYYVNVLAFESESTSATICSGTVESILDVVDTSGVARISNGRDELTIDLACSHLIPI